MMLILVLAGLSEAAEVECVGGFTTLASRDTTVVESPSGGLRLQIRDIQADEWWRVTVQLEGATKADRANVWVRRSEDQAGLRGPRLYTRVMGEPLLIAEGRGPVDEVPLQVRLSGLEIDELAMWMSELDWRIDSQQPAWAPEAPTSTSTESTPPREADINP